MVRTNLLGANLSNSKQDFLDRPKQGFNRLNSNLAQDSEVVECLVSLPSNKNRSLVALQLLSLGNQHRLQDLVEWELSLQVDSLASSKSLLVVLCLVNSLNSNLSKPKDSVVSEVLKRKVDSLVSNLLKLLQEVIYLANNQLNKQLCLDSNHNKLLVVYLVVPSNSSNNLQEAIFLGHLLWVNNQANSQLADQIFLVVRVQHNKQDSLGNQPLNRALSLEINHQDNNRIKACCLEQLDSRRLYLLDRVKVLYLEDKSQ